MKKLQARQHKLANRQISVKSIVSIAVTLLLALLNIVFVITGIFLLRQEIIVRPEGLAIYGSDGNLVDNPYASVGAYYVKREDAEPLWLISKRDLARLDHKDVTTYSRYDYDTSDRNLDTITLQLDPNLKQQFKIYCTASHISFNWLGQHTQNVGSLKLRDSFQVAFAPVSMLLALCLLITTSSCICAAVTVVRKILLPHHARTTLTQQSS